MSQFLIVFIYTGTFFLLHFKVQTSFRARIEKLFIRFSKLIFAYLNFITRNSAQQCFCLRQQLFNFLEWLVARPTDWTFHDSYLLQRFLFHVGNFTIFLCNFEIVIVLIRFNFIIDRIVFLRLLFIVFFLKSIFSAFLNIINCEELARIIWFRLLISSWT